MITFIRGQRGKLADLGLYGSLLVTLDVAAPGATVDVACFGLTADDRLSDERYMVFYNQKSAPNEAITLALHGKLSVFQLDLERLPASIDKLVFTAAMGESGSMRALVNSSMTLGPLPTGAPPAAIFAFSGADFTEEKAVIVGQLYRHDGHWRFAAVGQGFAGGLAALLEHFGGAEQPATPTAASPATLPATPPAKLSLSKITLEQRGDKVSLEKAAGQDYGRIRVNLNWHRRPGANGGGARAPVAGLIGKLLGQPQRRAGAAQAGAVDLDIGCLYETGGGARGAVQALGDSWGAFDRPPYIALDRDDRTGAAEGGENLVINGAHFDQLRRVLVYAFIYEGVPNWADTDGVVRIEIPGQPAVEVRLDRGTHEPMCAIALLENRGGVLQVTKQVEYFSRHGRMSAHQAMDEHFGFGLRWKPGSKN